MTCHIVVMRHSITKVSVTSVVEFCGREQDFLNGPVKDCVSQRYTDRFKTKHRFITKNANVAKLDSFIYCNP